MRLVFAGTPEFARLALTALHQAGHEIVAVLTQPDRVSGRGLELSMSPVKREALRLGLTVLQPRVIATGVGLVQSRPCKSCPPYSLNSWWWRPMV